MKCCHLYEIKAHKALKTVAARDAKLTALDLLYSNDFCNLITTCEMCHVGFDAYKIGIYPVDLRWIITDAEIEDSPSLTPYKNLHGRPIMQFLVQPTIGCT